MQPSTAGTTTLHGFTVYPYRPIPAGFRRILNRTVVHISTGPAAVYIINGLFL